MNQKQIRRLADIIYLKLFGMNTTALLIRFGLSPLCLEDKDDNELWNCMGNLALEAIVEIQTRCLDEYERSGGGVVFGIVEEFTGIIAEEVANEAKAMAAGQGIELLTGMEITQS